jgi:hypothetical protein
MMSDLTARDAAQEIYEDTFSSMSFTKAANSAHWMLGWMSAEEPEAIIRAITAWLIAGSPG